MLCHFEEAISAFEEALAIQSANSILFFRWSQALSYDELASLERLVHSQELIKKAMECYAKEKIFREQGKMVLKMLNLHNAAEAFEYQRSFIESQLRHKETEAVTTIAGTISLPEIIEIAADRCNIEDELIAQGKVPASRLENYKSFTPVLEEEEERCFAITRRLLAKCKDLIEFNIETMNDAQLALAKVEYSKVAKVLGRLNFIKDLPIEKNNGLCDQSAARIGVEIDVRLQTKAWKVKMEQVSEIYGKADFNYHLFTAALQDHLAEAKKQQEKQKKDKPNSDNQLDDLSKARPFGLSPATQLVCFLASILLMVVAFLVIVRYVTGSNISLYNLGLVRPPNSYT